MDKSKPIHAINDVLVYLKFISNKKQEYFVCLSLDSAQRLVTRRTVTIGTLTSTLVHPREVFAGPLKDRAASIIVAHNHPSGDPHPSKKDITITQQLIAAGLLLGVPLRDHVIISKDSYFNFRDNGLL